jgi:hypothetical protein
LLLKLWGEVDVGGIDREAEGEPREREVGRAAFGEPTLIEYDFLDGKRDALG